MEEEDHESGQPSKTTELGTTMVEPSTTEYGNTGSTTDVDVTAADVLSPNERPRKRARFEDPAEVPPYRDTTPGGGEKGDPQSATANNTTDSASVSDSATAFPSAPGPGPATASTSTSTSVADEREYNVPLHLSTSPSVDRDTPTASLTPKEERPSADSLGNDELRGGNLMDPVTGAAAGDELVVGDTAAAASNDSQKRDWEETQSTPEAADAAVVVVVAEQGADSEEDPHGAAEPPPAKRQRLDPEASAEGSQVGGAVGDERPTVPPAQPRSESEPSPPPATDISHLPLS